MSDPDLPTNPVAAADALRTLAKQAPANPMDAGPLDFVGRLPDAVKERVARPALHSLTRDADPVVRLRALGALAALPRASATVDVLLDLAKTKKSAFSEVIEEGGLSEALQHALYVVGDGSGREEQVVQAILAVAGAAMPMPWTFTLIGAFRPDDAIRLARTYAPQHRDARPWTALVLTVGKYHRDQLLELLTALRGVPPALKPEILAEAHKIISMSDSDIAAWAAHGGFGPPRNPAPSHDDCKRALGI